MGRAEEKFPWEVKIFLQPRHLSPPNPVYKSFYPRGTFSTLTPYCPTWPTDRTQTPHPTQPTLLRLHIISMEAAPATMARPGQSHAPNPGPQ